MITSPIIVFRKRLNLLILELKTLSDFGKNQLGYNAIYKEEAVNFYSNISITDQNKTLNPEILTTLPEYYAHTLVYIWVAPFLIFIGTVGKIKAVYSMAFLISGKQRTG